MTPDQQFERALAEGKLRAEIADATIQPSREAIMTPDEELRLELLRMSYPAEWPTSEIIKRASALYDFVTGKDRAALAEEAKAAIDRAVR